MTWVIVRVRGSVHAKHEIVETLHYLHLTRANHATVLPEEASVRGMLHRVQGYVTWGEADETTVGLLLHARGRTPDGKSLTPTPADPSPSAEIATLAKTVTSGGVHRATGVRPLFRLRAPKGGWRSTKKPFALGGALGYRGRAINDLVRKML